MLTKQCYFGDNQQVHTCVNKILKEHSGRLEGGGKNPIGFCGYLLVSSVRRQDDISSART